MILGTILSNGFILLSVLLILVLGLFIVLGIEKLVDKIRIVRNKYYQEKRKYERR